MISFKCKMCGGTIEFEQGCTVGVCDSCGTKQTLPRLDDDKKANLYDRANHFRRNNDFDKATGIYDQILNEYNTDAEAYWSLVLCRYGIEYVEDPSTHKRIPTVNRAQFTSIYMDENYKSALQYADVYQKNIYEEEAKAIDDIQKGILEISNKEAPFDVFICYKETDANGRRTQDSVLATELYHELTNEGYKVFFSRITLEDKLGIAYEPYIFAALNSSKVMVAIGTKPEYFNAVWVKNEWSRYLALIKNGAKKMLIPAYRDMDPYDLPEEFSHLQAQDMSKLGFMQDLIRGIKKIISPEVSQTPIKEKILIEKSTSDVINTSPLLRRAFLFVEDGNWQDANTYCEKVLDQNPENGEAYLVKLMVEYHKKKRENLKECENPFDSNSNYLKAYRFGSPELKKELEEYNKYIKNGNENKRQIKEYETATILMESADNEEKFKDAAEHFKSANGYKNSNVLAGNCLKEAERYHKDAVYASAKSSMTEEKIAAYETAIKTFQMISDWKDADKQIYVCQRKIEEIKAREEAKRIAYEKAAKIRKKIIAIGAPIVCACIAFLIVLNTVIIPYLKYNNAVEKYGKEWADTIKSAVVGDTITFGTYEQDNNTSNGKEAIEWTVLEKKGMSLLLVSKQALDCQQYYTSETIVTWKSCTLRQWMNGTFLNNAFSAEEQAQIQNTTVSADMNPIYSTNSGNATTDKVFLLSITETKRYFTSDSARQCNPTKYAVANGAFVNSNNGNCWWWLRSPGNYQDFAADVLSDGSVDCSGYAVNYDSGCVRPALWIDLAS